MSFNLSSSPEDNCHQISAAKDKQGQTPAAEPRFEERVPPDELEEPGHLNSKPGVEANALEKADIQQHFLLPLGENKGSDNIEGKAGSSSDGGSDSESESDSSDSGSDSGSHSKSRSRSPVGSRSGSSSDSESDASSNSKEGSDEDVDIMTSDDDKEPQHKLQPSEPALPSSPVPWRSPNAKPIQGGIAEKQGGQESDAVEIEKDFPDDEREYEMAVDTSLVPHKEGEKCVEESKLFSPNHDNLQEHPNYMVSLFGERENTVKESFRHEQSDHSDRISKGKPKRGSDMRHLEEKFERTKRLKADAQPLSSGGWDIQLSESSHNLSPERFSGKPYKGSTMLATNRTDRDEDTDSVVQKGYKSSSDFKQSGRRSFDQSTRIKTPDTAERLDENSGSLVRGQKYSEKSFHVHENFPTQKDKFSKDTLNQDGYANDKKVSKNSKEVAAAGKQSVPFDSRHRKHGEMQGKSKEAGQFSSTLTGSSPRDNSRIGVNVSLVVNGKGNLLQRELSDLELGELREPLPEETPGKKKLESKNSFKQLDNRLSSSDNWNSDLSKGKPLGKTTLESGKPSPPFQNTGLHSNLDSSNKKRNTEDQAEDLQRLQNRIMQSQPQHLSKVDHAEVAPQVNKLADGSAKSRQKKVKASQGVGLESNSESNRKASRNTPQQHDAKRGLVSHSIKEIKQQTSDTIGELTDGRKDLIWAEGNNSDRKRRDSSSDENSCSYSKYEKDKPELKGPIIDFSQ